MIVNKNITDYLVYQSTSLQDALKKINDNKHQIVYAVDEQNRLYGSLSDGDIRRWLLSCDELSLDVDISFLVKKPCFYLHQSADHKTISNSFNERISSIPLVDDNNHVVAIAEPSFNRLVIGDKEISIDSPAFIIAEIGNNHQGDIKLAKQLVDLACEANVDCIKFQMRNMDKLYRNAGVANDASADLGAQYTLELLSKFQLSDDELFEVFDYCKSKGALPLCTPWDLGSLEKLEQYGMPAYKVASADFTNFELLEALALTGKPIICSTGMSTENEIVSTIDFLNRKNAQYVLLHCNSTYPTPFKDVNLRYLKKLKELSNGIVGYSGHERGWSVPVTALAFGAKIIEKHFTIDRGLEGNDHKVSLLPDELKMMVQEIRNVEESLGSDKTREITQGELMNREVLAKSLVVNCDLEIGEIIQRNMIGVVSPGQGLQPNRIEEIIGKPAVRVLKQGDVLFESDITGGVEKKSNYSFDAPYGIPVRYHDYLSLTQDVDLDFVEFHLSYKDLEVDFNEFIPSIQDIKFAVHAPELFSGDHLLDLAASDKEYRARSILELQRVIEQTKQLNKLFPKTEKPVIVVNAGGWNTAGFLDQEIKEEKYRLIKDSFNQLDMDGVEISIQTMPPFPWHFGGQSYHNLFLCADEMAEFCLETGLKICLDVSHSMMACNYYSWDLYDFIEKIKPYIVHIHISDAKGVDGEGVQIGYGDVDFHKLGLALNGANAQFIPEIWQGHTNGGEGFWKALDFLEKKSKL